MEGRKSWTRAPDFIIAGRVPGRLHEYRSRTAADVVSFLEPPVTMAGRQDRDEMGQDVTSCLEYFPEQPLEPIQEILATGSHRDHDRDHHRFRFRYRYRYRSPSPIVPAAIGASAEECAIAFEVSDVESSTVSAGGVTTANLPQAARNLRQSSSTVFSVSIGGSS